MEQRGTERLTPPGWLGMMGLVLLSVLLLFAASMVLGVGSGAPSAEAQARMVEAQGVREVLGAVAGLVRLQAWLVVGLVAVLVLVLIVLLAVLALTLVRRRESSGPVVYVMPGRRAEMWRALESAGAESAAVVCAMDAVSVADGDRPGA